MITYIIYKYMTFKEVQYVSNLQPRKYIWTEENVKKNRYKDILPCKFKMPLMEQMDMLISSFIA